MWWSPVVLAETENDRNSLNKLEIIILEWFLRNSQMILKQSKSSSNIHTSTKKYKYYDVVGMCVNCQLVKAFLNYSWVILRDSQGFLSNFKMILGWFSVILKLQLSRANQCESLENPQVIKDAWRFSRDAHWITRIRMLADSIFSIKYQICSLSLQENILSPSGDIRW